MSYNRVHPTGRRVLAAALVAACVSAVGAGNAMASYTVTAPSSVPTTYTDSTPLANPPTDLVSGLTVNLSQITPTTGLYNGGPGNLEGGPGTSGYPNLQGMANLEALAQNGAIAVQSDGTPGTGTGSATYTSTPYFSYTDTAINANHLVAINNGGGSTSIADTLNGRGDPLLTNILGSTSLPASAATSPWQDIIFNQTGYVHVSQANSSYTFAVQSSDGNDDGTEILLGGTGQAGSGTVVGFQNADSIQPSNGVATLVDGDTYSAAVDTVTFTDAGYYPFEIFNAQTWGGAGENVSFAPVSSAPNLTFYTTATPEPAPWLLLGIGVVSAALSRRRLIR